MKKFCICTLLIFSALICFTQKDTSKKLMNITPVITNNPVTGILKLPSLSGWVDMHTHPMSYLGFGRKAMHGAPDIGCIIPAGTRDCNPASYRAKSAADALGHCNSTHGGWGVDNGCGDYLRAGIINYALDDKFVFKSDNIHGDHHHAGYPDLPYWPHQSSILHQQMWWEWIKRAYDGGLRVMVALTVNSELLAELINGDQPYDDKSVADLQIDETVAFVNRHRDFMEIAYSAADLRRIVSANKLAVILGMEVDKIGNFGKPGVLTKESTVIAEIKRLYSKGIRYVFPIHLIDNSFGGTAVYSMLFNFANRHANGYMFRVTSSKDPYVRYRANLTDGPLGFENGLILGARGFLEGLGQIPAPCFNDLIKCSPPPGKVRCCGSYEKVLNMLTPSVELDAYKFIGGGHVNSLGITGLGDIAINEMMKLGMIIDVDHMSELSMTSVIERAEKVPGGYPLVMGHNGIRGADGKERNAPLKLVRRVAALGGMFGVGTSHATPDEFVQNYRAVWEAMGKRAVAVGTDVNGFEPLPKHMRSKDAGTSTAFYTGFFKDSPIKTKSGISGSTRTWDYIKEGGVSHYGLMPEFFYDVKTSAGGTDVITNLMSSSEHFAQMWAKCETASKKISGAPTGGTYTYSIPAITNLCPSQKIAGDNEFGGHGPHIKGTVSLRISPDGTNLQAVITFNAKETTSDWSEVRGSWTINIGEPAPAGLRYTSVNGEKISSFDRVLSGGGRNEVLEGCDGGEHIITPAGGPVSKIIVVGDTGGGDISADNDCNCDTRIVRIELKPVSLTLAPR
jgi:microsomal dipeptidase-like Zn-dependent dipeptidase